MTLSSLSLILLSRNEEKIIEKNIHNVLRYLNSLNYIKNFEILICDKSDDQTPIIVNNISKQFPQVRLIKVHDIGIGAGIKSGIDNARYPIVCSNGIEIPTGFSFIGDSFKKIVDGYDIVVATRGNSGFIDNRPLKRKIFSKCYNLLINLVFHLSIPDTQSAVTFKLSEIKNFRENLQDDGPFLQTEILIHAKLNCLKLLLMPTNFNDVRKDSKIRVFSFSIDMLKQIFAKKRQLKRL